MDEIHVYDNNRNLQAYIVNTLKNYNKLDVIANLMEKKLIADY